MKRNCVSITAVLLLLLFILAACGGATSEDTESAAPEDVEAVGSESAGVVLPTPIMGAKVQPTRMGAGTAVPNTLDILIITQAADLSVDTLDTLAAELNLFDMQVALSFYGDPVPASAPLGVADFTADMSELTAVLNQPSAITQTVTIADALLAGMQLSGWRENSSYRLVLLVTEPPFPLNEEAAITEWAATAAEQNRRIYPILMGDMDTVDLAWEDVALVTNGRVILLDNFQVTEGALATAISGIVAELISGDTP